MVPDSFSQPKFLLGFLALLIGMLGSIMYSVPPFRLKARPFLDIFGTFLIIGLFIPFYIGLLGSATLVDLNLIGLGIILSVILVMGIHLPTMLIDIETDRVVGDNTTVVFLGMKKAIYLTAGVVLLRVLLLIVLNFHLMNIGLLITNWTPFILGIIEIIAVYNLLCRQDQEGSLLLYRTIIITSGGGAVIFGLLYSPALLVAYSL
jgi:1,4-dihydroxy-2-naphthoate octaprenyltransferase